jgi:hypothetical protein
MTERLRLAAEAYSGHSIECSVCGDPRDRIKCCDIGERLLPEFYDALQDAARQEGRQDDNS